jgi:signal transduction histidine kinase
MWHSKGSPTENLLCAMTLLPLDRPLKLSEPYPVTRDWLGLTPFHPIKSRFWRWGLIALTSLTYVGLGMFTFKALNLPGPQAFAIFPPVGFSVAMVAIFGSDALVGVFLGACAFAFWLGTDRFVALWAASRSSLEAYLFSYLLQVARVDIRLRRLRDVLGLVIFAAPLPVAINAVLACTNEMIVGHTTWATLPKSLWTLLIADMVSILMLAPLLIVIGAEWLSSRWSRQWDRLQQFWQLRRHGWEGLLWLGFTLFIGLRNPDTHVGQFLMESLPCLSLAWAATRFGVLTTVCASFWINSVEIVRALHSQGAFVRQATGDLSLALLLLQTFIAVMVVMGLSLAALTEERQKLLQEILQERNFDRVIIDIAHRVSYSLDINEIMNIAVQGIYTTLKVDRAYILQIMMDGTSLVTAEACGPNWTPCLGTTLPANLVAEITAWYRENGIEVTPDIRTDRQMHPFTRKLCEQYQVQARIGIPVLVNGEGYGLLSVHQCDRPRHWTRQEIGFLEQLVVPLGAALHQVLLYQRERNLVVELDRQVQIRTDELQRSLVAQEHLNEGQTRLLHAVSHDLRTPIIGSLLVLRQMQKRDPIIASSVIQQLEASSERQLTLIQALLEDYRADDATLRFNFKTINYGDLIQQTLRTLAPILEQNQAQVKINLAPDLPPVQADTTHIQRVLENLITNALKHNPPGLTVELAAHRLAEGGSDYLRCSVADDGVGIPAEVANQLFLRPYLRSMHGSARTGMGLGLYLSHQIIIAHGGQLKVEAGDGAGVRFVFTLPIAQVPSEVIMQPPLQGRESTTSA